MRERRREQRRAGRTLEASRYLGGPRDPREAGLDRAEGVLAQALGAAPIPNGKRHRERLVVIRDAVPELFDQLETLDRRQLEQLLAKGVAEEEASRAGARATPGGRLRRLPPL